MDPHAKEAAAAVAGMAETYGMPTPKIGDLVWYQRPPPGPSGRTCGRVLEVLGIKTRDPLLVIQHSLTNQHVIHRSDLAADPYGGAADV